MMNVWGDNFADGGFFRIENADTLRFSVPTHFYDVYSNFDMLNNLIPKKMSNKDTAVLEKLIYINQRLENFQTKHGLKMNIEYLCPLCDRKSSTFEIVSNSGVSINLTNEYACILCKQRSHSRESLIIGQKINYLNNQNSEFSLEIPQISLDHLEIVIID